jgi:ribonuclease HI
MSRLYHVEEVYADGGVILKNPSPIGGTWAYCHIADGVKYRHDSGLVRPAHIQYPFHDGVTVVAGMDSISNNLTEFYALLMAIEDLPYGWCGRVFTDSGVTLQRFEDPANVKMKGIPDDWVRRLHNVRRHLGRLEFVLLGGHPNRKELESGIRKDGKPVSKWNVWCDETCGQLADTLTAQLNLTGSPTTGAA